MTEADLAVVCSKIEEQRQYFHQVSREIWKTPELCFKEVQAHALLTSSLKKYGFRVQKHYFMPTAFRAEFSTSETGGTVAFLLEYDALPDIGHACGHNLIAEAGLSAAIAAKSAMEQDTTIAGKLVVMGTPAEESGGGKIKLLELGAFDGVDAALMVHPSSATSISPRVLSCIQGFAKFKGKEAHAGSHPWLGVNALDAAVALYQSIALLRQQIKPDSRINVIISQGGSAVNVIPDESRIEFLVRAPTLVEMRALVSRVESCIEGAAKATGCHAEYTFRHDECYQNLITNRVIISHFERYLKKSGFDMGQCIEITSGGSTDMGNVSHKIPSIHPLYSIPTDCHNHSRGFTEHAGAEAAQQPTLDMAKAMAMTALHLLRNPLTLQAAQQQLQMNLLEEELVDKTGA